MDEIDELSFAGKGLDNKDLDNKEDVLEKEVLENQVVEQEEVKKLEESEEVKESKKPKRKKKDSIITAKYLVRDIAPDGLVVNLKGRSKKVRLDIGYEEMMSLYNNKEKYIGRFIMLQIKGDSFLPVWSKLKLVMVM